MTRNRPHTQPNAAPSNTQHPMPRHHTSRRVRLHPQPRPVSHALPNAVPSNTQRPMPDRYYFKVTLTLSLGDLNIVRRRNIPDSGRGPETAVQRLYDAVRNADPTHNRLSSKAYVKKLKADYRTYQHYIMSSVTIKLSPIDLCDLTRNATPYRELPFPQVRDWNERLRLMSNVYGADYMLLQSLNTARYRAWI